MPGLFDLPLDKLKTYQGCNPRPADFDAYWDAALAEMREVDPRVELKPAEFQTSFAECSHLYFTGVGGARIHAKFLRPRGKPEPHPAILCFHGYTYYSGDWVHLLRYTAAGFTVAALDCRGQGGLSEDVGGVVGNTSKGHVIRGLDDKPENLLFRRIFLDTAQLAGILMQMPDVDPLRVAAQGPSQGGGLTLACAALEPRIARAAPLYPFLSDFQRTWELDLLDHGLEELKGYFKLFDPRHTRHKEIFTRLGYIDTQFLASRIKADVLWGICLNDTTCPPSTQFATYNKLTCRKEMIVYPDFDHELQITGWLDTMFQFVTRGW